MVQKKSQLDECAEVLAKEGVVAFPTDTLYGIASLISSETAFGTVLIFCLFLNIIQKVMNLEK